MAKQSKMSVVSIQFDGCTNEKRAFIHFSVYYHIIRQMLLEYILVTIQECGRVISCSIPSIDFGTSEWPKCDCCPM